MGGNGRSERDGTHASGEQMTLELKDGPRGVDVRPEPLIGCD